MHVLSHTRQPYFSGLAIWRLSTNVLKCQLAENGDGPSLSGQESPEAPGSSDNSPASVPLPTIADDSNTVPNLRHCLQENEFHSLLYYGKKAVSTSSIPLKEQVQIMHGIIMLSHNSFSNCVIVGREIFAGKKNFTCSIFMLLYLCCYHHLVKNCTSQNFTCCTSGIWNIINRLFKLHTQ